MDPPSVPGPRQHTVEPPYAAILDELRIGKAVPFLGAGASRVGPQEAGGSVLPSASQLASILADYGNFPSTDTRERSDLSKVSSYLVDGTSRGGAIVGIWRQLKIPIYFIGLGEQPDDLQPFSAENYAQAIFGLE